MKLINAGDLKKKIKKHIDINVANALDKGWNLGLETAIFEIDKASPIEPKLSDKQIEEIADLLETHWGYEGIREDVSRILKGDAE